MEGGETYKDFPYEIPFRDVNVCKHCEYLMRDVMKRSFTAIDLGSIYHVCEMDLKDHDCGWLKNVLDTRKMKKMKKLCEQLRLYPFEIRTLPNGCPYYMEHFVGLMNLTFREKCWMCGVMISKCLLTSFL